MNRRIDRGYCIFVLSLAFLGLSAGSALCEDSQDLKSRVPSDQLEQAKALQNPFPITKEFVEKGRVLYEGKAFCSACHGRDGTGTQMEMRSSAEAEPSPTNFADAAWQAARSNGELFWILQHGSHGTDMAPFLPLYLSEEQAWQIVAYIRSLGKI